MGHTPSGDDGREVMGRVQGADASALAELYDRFAGAVYRQALAVLRSREDAEDVVQETFAHVWLQARQYAGERGSVAGWILMIGRARAIDRWRRRRRQSEVLLDRDVAAPGAGSAASLDVRQALSHLRPVERLSIELAYSDGYTHEEIASNLDVPLGTVKGRIRSGLRHLRHDLAPREDH